MPQQSDHDYSRPAAVVANEWDGIPPPQPTQPHRLKVAICLTGQLLRLELLSKIRNFIVYNAMAMGHKMDTFVYLDNNPNEAKQTYWRFDYASESMYRNFSAKKLRLYMEKHIGDAAARLAQLNNQHHFQYLKPSPASMIVRVRLAPPPQSNFTVVHGIVPVEAKTGPHTGPRVKGDLESAEERFQNNMRWMSGLRESARWVQLVEQRQGWFYDLVVRLRDDTYVFGPWILTPEKYRGAFVTAQIANNFGVNDHNFVIDRQWADHVFRGITEDYYFNESLHNTKWINPEHRLYEVVKTKNVPFRFNDVCAMPLVPLRGKKSSTHWRIHSTYKNNLLDDCDPIKKSDDDDLVRKATAKALGTEWKPKSLPMLQAARSPTDRKDSEQRAEERVEQRIKGLPNQPKLGPRIGGRVMLAGGGLFGWIFGSSDTGSASPDNSESGGTIAAISSIGTTTLNSFFAPSQTVEPTPRPTMPPTTLSERMRLEGSRSCCPYRWIKMLEDEEAKIFV